MTPFGIPVLGRCALWIERTISKSSSGQTVAAVQLAPVVIPIVVAEVLTRSMTDALRQLTMGTIFGVGLLWLLFSGWQIKRIFPAKSIKADRYYDRKTKYDLPPEYADSESATEAEQRHNR